jgi:hypothetical protein
LAGKRNACPASNHPWPQQLHSCGGGKSRPIGQPFGICYFSSSAARNFFSIYILQEIINCIFQDTRKYRSVCMNTTVLLIYLRDSVMNFISDIFTAVVRCSLSFSVSEERLVCLLRPSSHCNNSDYCCIYYLRGCTADVIAHNVP